MKKWQIGAVAGALVFSLFATGCGEQIDQNAGIATSAPATEAPTEAATAAPELTERAKKLLAQNPDTVGYITIDGTQVDNPVVQTADNEYYLDHGFDGQEFRAGTVFMDCTDSFGAYPDQWSENIVLYGHAQRDSQQHRKDQQPCLFRHGEKSFQLHHRNSFPSRDSGPRRSFSPYCSSQMSPVMVMSPVSTLTSLM